MRSAPTIWNSNREIYGEPATMSPDRTFVRKLKALDPSLDVVWNRFKERWIIIEKGHISGRWHVVARLENPDGSYRPLDERILRELQFNRFMFEKGVKEYADFLDAQDEAEEAERVRDYERELESVGNWYALQMMGIPHFQIPKKYEEVQKNEKGTETA